MRMWMIAPSLLCNKHLLGEHSELHKFLPSFRKGISVHGRFYPLVQVQMNAYFERHEELVEEMLKRGMNHKSPLIDIPNFREIYPNYFDLVVNQELSKRDLCSRCDECRRRIEVDFLIRRDG